MVNSKKIIFNKPYQSSQSIKFINNAIKRKTISGNGFYTEKCHNFFKKKYGFKSCYLTTSCTDALEMVAILINTNKNDEIIMPSFSFVSTANAFLMRGASIKFADSNQYNPNIDVRKIESLINKKTKAILVVHYAGFACDMENLKNLALKYNLYLIEDCAHAIDSYLHEKPLGSYGDFSAFSFHDTKNITSGEGGLLVINNKKFTKRAEIIREKGTNRTAFFRGAIKKYTWVDIGSSFLASDLTAAFLYGQLLSLNKIQKKRVKIFNLYYTVLSKSIYFKKKYTLPNINKNLKINGHCFYLVTKSKLIRDELLKTLEKEKIQALSHYIPLHSSPFYKNKHGKRSLPNCDRFSETILRLPIHFYLSNDDVKKILKVILKFFEFNG